MPALCLPCTLPRCAVVLQPAGPLTGFLLSALELAQLYHLEAT